MGYVRAKWIRPDGRPLPRNSQERGQTLYIQDVQREDAGQYACQGQDARSGRIIFTKTTTVVVAGNVQIMWQF